MKRFFLFFIVLCYSLFVSGQGSITFTDKDFILSPSRDKSIDSVLILQPAYKTLSHEEREAVYWINYVRKHPQKFSKEVLNPFLSQFPEVKNSYSKSLLEELQNSISLQYILPAEKLNTVAFKHAKDLGSKGASISHSSTNGDSFQKRMQKAGLVNCIVENVFEGRNDALQSIIFLLIDNGVKSLGHRKNILAPDSRFIGISFYPIKNKNPLHFLVQDFSCE